MSMENKNAQSSQLNRSHQWYGWIPSLPHQRPKLCYIPRLGTVLPTTQDNRDRTIAYFDQLALGSCTANSLSRHLMLLLKKQGAPVFVPSRLMLYWLERSIEGTVDSDSGAIGSDGVAAMKETGVCPETMWPYDITQFTVKPPQPCFDDATKHQLLQSIEVPQNDAGVRGCLADGYWVSYGFSVGSSFESDSVSTTGIVPIPAPGEKIVGGHEVLLAGYTDDIHKVHSMGNDLVLPDWARQITSWGITDNSWGGDWGDKGSFYVPLSDILNPDRTSDLQSLRLVEVAPA